MRIMITGGCGFIGSAVVRHVIGATGHTVVNIDAMTPAATRASTADAASNPRYRHVRADITDGAAMRAVFAAHQPEAVLHLAAESQADPTTDAPGACVATNVLGTFTLLEAARDYWNGLDMADRMLFRFHHVSTDAVFGPQRPGAPPFTQATPYAPRSPYSASKAASDHLVRAWQHTYGLPTFVTSSTNNYGFWHFPEKLIPLMTINAIAGRPLPVYGDGGTLRDWLFVDDHAEALVLAVERGRPGETYAIGARQPRTTLQVVRAICTLMDELRPDPAGPHARLIRSVANGPAHDRRSAIDPSHAEAALGWRPRHDFETGLRRTVQWYLGHRAWWTALHARQGSTHPTEAAA
ncbi:dTDP-glucose 4,6-dehydratase [Gluconacetobacter liquefaciens]|uniref:dTDP-glucose 4,6-dehydratase n=1 Tax=Gluconacetobacter liquefaciens TaxID=89584 RepID=A0A370GAQ2_GLULI|nr:dTDP-glucose 4,6-dehydratase [Gluconacetobacter liquefaciens]MBB2185357.1 dTDP-glucose 4,6-dehydratase [Gluconacetobacter liquefaciens]RDI40801.1 dTDP-glucose 4,6-dehydratase [Gluconacetobacter liquefaciens]